MSNKCYPYKFARLRGLCYTDPGVGTHLGRSTFSTGLYFGRTVSLRFIRRCQ